MKRDKIIDYLRIILVTIVLALIIKIYLVDAYRIPTGSMEDTLIAGDYILVNKLIYSIRNPKRGEIIVFKFPGERDDVISSSNLNYIKRVIGLPGETIEIRDRRVYIDGLPFESVATVKKGEKSLQSVDQRDLRIFPPGAEYNEDNYGPVYVPQRGDTLFISLDNVRKWKVLIQREGNEIDILSDGDINLNGEQRDYFVVKDNYYFTLGDNRNNSLDSRFWGFVPEENIIGKAAMIYWSWDLNFEQGDRYNRFGSIRYERLGKRIR